jgi:hypothetical protein
MKDEKLAPSYYLLGVCAMTLLLAVYLAAKKRA